jgi:DNA-directed RNA polymerase I subunit RPA1
VGYQFTSKVLQLIHKSLRTTGEKVAHLAVGAEVEAHQAAAAGKKHGGGDGDGDAEDGGEKVAGQEHNDAQDDGEKSDEDEDEDGDDGQGTLRFGSKKEVEGYDDDEEDTGGGGGGSAGRLAAEDSADDEDGNADEQGDGPGLGGTPQKKLLLKDAARSSSSSNSMGKDVDLIRVMPSVSKSHFFRGCYGKEADGWIEVQVEFPVTMRKLLLVALAQKAASAALVRHCTGIQKIHVLEKKDKTAAGGVQFAVQTEGVNFPRLWEMDAINVNRLETNDIHRVLTTYGVEAARVSIAAQIAAVFAVYGIAVDSRHLGLLADYMTFNGGFRPLNRAGMEDRYCNPARHFHLRLVQCCIVFSRLV